MSDEEAGIGVGDSAPGEPLSLGVRQFVAARVAEITSLTAQIGSLGGAQGRGKGFSFQHVSKHMRRRAVSHNPKRLPSRLRQSHLSQLLKSSGGVVKKPKRPRRKYRKRSDGDILEYNRRQLVNPKWLESHIWHAKRFHMKCLWDRKLAIAPTAKCFRSLFRAARQGVIMQDISYLAVLEISGPVSIIVDGMSRLISDDFPRVPHFNREFITHVRSPSNSAYLGPMKYIWAPSETPTHLKLIGWLHPALKSFVVEEIQKCFELVEQKLVIDFPEFPNKDEKKHLWKLASKQCWVNQNTLMSLKDLNGNFNRIRLVGPKALAIIKEILKVGCLAGLNDTVILEQQEETWKNLQKVINIPDGTVIPLNVIDPRRELPDKRRPVKQSREDNTLDNNTPFNSNLLVDSPLWQEEMRRAILRNKTSDEQLSQSRSKSLIPGTKITDGKEPDVVPIALVTRSYNSSFPGVDLILPCGWLMPFWIALSYRCVRSYALEFNDYLTFEDDPYLLNLSTSALFSPDSVVYPQEIQKTDEEARDKYFSYPPAKRQNVIKLGCAFPFSTDWPSFLRFLSLKSTQDFSPHVRVLRKRSDLQILATCLRNFDHNHEIFKDSSCLYPIQVVLLSGAAEKGACICLPTQEDLNTLTARQLSHIDILQQPFKDTNEQKRAELSRQHHKRLSRLRKKRKVARRSALGSNKDFDLNSRLKELDSKVDVDKYNQEMNNLWLNDNVQEVLSKQDRDIMGFTEYAHFSFVRGKSAAMGYVTLGQLKRLLELHKTGDNVVKGKRALRVLVRNWASSLTYHWARLEYPTSF